MSNDIPKYKRIGLTVSLPSPVYDAVMREVTISQETPSWIITQKLAIAFGMNPKALEKDRRRPRKTITTPTAEVQAIGMNLPYPSCYMDVANKPYRPMLTYASMLMDGGYYLVDGKPVLVPEEDKPALRKMKEQFAY